MKTNIINLMLLGIVASCMPASSVQAAPEVIAIKCSGYFAKGEFDASVYITGVAKHDPSEKLREVSIYDHTRNKWLDIRNGSEVSPNSIQMINIAALYEPYGYDAQTAYQLRIDRQSGSYYWQSEGHESRGDCEKTAFVDPPARPYQAPMSPPPNKF